MMSLQWYDFVGFVGVLLVLGAYAGQQSRRVRGDGEWVSLINFFGAGGILVPVIYAEQMNWPVFLIESVWMLISLYGFALALRTRMQGWRGGAQPG